MYLPCNNGIICIQMKMQMEMETATEMPTGTGTMEEMMEGMTAVRTAKVMKEEAMMGAVMTEEVVMTAVLTGEVSRLNPGRGRS